MADLSHVFGDPTYSAGIVDPDNIGFTDTGQIIRDGEPIVLIPSSTNTQSVGETQNEQRLQGVQGVQGEIGLQGTQGLQGVQGTQGIQGIQGTQGLQGVQGTQGMQGIQGGQGAKGLQGTQGLQGIQGTSVPTPTAQDAGKMLVVNENGEYELVTIADGESIEY